MFTAGLTARGVTSGFERDGEVSNSAPDFLRVHRRKAQLQSLALDRAMEKVQPDLAVPAWPQFLRGCLRYRESLDAQLPNAPRVTDEFEEPPNVNGGNKR